MEYLIRWSLLIFDELFTIVFLSIAHCWLTSHCSFILSVAAPCLLVVKGWFTDNLTTIKLVIIRFVIFVCHNLFLVDLSISWSLYIDLLITCLLLIRWSAIHYCFVKQLFIINSLISYLLLFIDQLLCVEPGARVSSLEELRQVPCLRKADFDQILEKQIAPDFTPPVRATCCSIN